MRIADEFFKDLCLVAKKHGVELVGTSIAKVGDDGGIEVELLIFSKERNGLAPESVWQIQNGLMAYGFRRERFPVATGELKSEPGAIGADPVVVTGEHLVSVCKHGRGAQACGFLAYSRDGMCCVKGSRLDSMVQERRASGSLRAMGDNCSGPPSFEVLKEA